MNCNFQGLYVYRAANTVTYPLLSQITKFTLTLHYTVTTVTVNISIVVMLVFWLCQFNTGNLACGLCLSSSTAELLVWWFQFNICSLGYI